MLDKIALNKADPITGVIVRSCVICLATIVMMLVTGKTKVVLQTDYKSIGLFALTGLLAGFLAMITYYGALKIAPTSKIVPLAATYALISAILAVMFLKEQPSLGRIIGTVLIITGVWLVK